MRRYSSCNLGSTTPRQDWTAVDCAGEVVASIPAASAVLGAQRADVIGTARLQPAVSMVRGFDFLHHRSCPQGRGPHKWILPTLCCTERKKRRLARPISENG